MLVRVNKQVAELLKGLDSSNLLGLLRKSHNVEVLVQIENLLQVLLLHLVSRGAELAVVSLLGVQQLVDDNVVGVNVKRGQVLDHSLCLVQRQELGNANTHKGGEVGVLELGVDLRDGGSGLVELCEHVVSRGTPLASHQRAKHGAKSAGKLGDLAQSLLQNGGEGQESQSVAGGSSIEDDDGVGCALDLLEDLGKGHGLVNTGDREGNVLHHVSHAGSSASCALGLLDHLLNGPTGVNLHAVQVVDTIHRSGVLAELLAKGVRKVVCGISGDEQNGLSVLGQLDGKGTGGGGLTNTSLTTDKDPSERVLVNDVLERGGGGVFVHCVFF